MSEFEYYLNDKPRMYPDVAVMEIVRNMKLNYGMQFHMDEMRMVHSAVDYTEHIRKQMANELGHKMLEEGKIKFTSFDNPIYNGRTLRGETIVMTENELYALLQRFGIYVKATKDREKL